MRPSRLLVFLVTALIVTGCGGTGTSESASALPSAFGVSSAAPSAGTSPSRAAASLRFEWPAGATPAVTPTLDGMTHKFVNPGAVIESDGKHHMFANMFSAWPGPMDIVHLTSSDGSTWEATGKQPVLTADDVPFADPGIDVSTGFVAADGTWVLLIESVSSLDPWVIGRATAPGPDGPWTVDPKPVLEPGPAGSKDAGGVAWPTVVPTAGGFAMFYTAYDRPRGAGVIAMATSTDGKTWAKRAEPVLTGGSGWEHNKVDRPRVVRTPQGLLMVYSGALLTDRGVAWSNDGIEWRRDGERPAITKASFPTGTNAWDAALVARGDSVDYYLEIGSTTGDGTKVYRAVAALP